jgi:hypothetical protein
LKFSNLSKPANLVGENMTKLLICLFKLPAESRKKSAQQEDRTAR